MQTRKAHLIGICGAGMSAVARLLQQSGYEVSGSDEGFYPPVSDYLVSLGLHCRPGYRPENIPANVDLIVIGKNAKLREDNNDEVAAAFANHHAKIRSFPQILAELTKAHNRIVVAGSYGKSTVTSLISWVLIHAGKMPGYFIGAIPKGFEHSSDLGDQKEAGAFVFEGDEYPSAHFDDRAKFLHYTPQQLVLTSACHDHVNIYPTHEDYLKPFQALLTELQTQNGHLIASLEEISATHLFKTFKGRKTSYGLSETCDYHAKAIKRGHVTRFDLYGPEGVFPGQIETTQIGDHNIENIVGAAACLLENEMVSFEAFKAAILNFSGLHRRLDLKSEATRLAIYEGFGSSYEKARAAIHGLLQHYPDRHLHIVFEPHTFSWRNKAAISHYESVFDGAKSVWLYAPPIQGADTHDQLSLDEIVAKTEKHHQSVHRFSAENYRAILAGLNPLKDVVLLLSSGNFDGLLQEIVSHSEAAFPA